MFLAIQPKTFPPKVEKGSKIMSFKNLTPHTINLLSTTGEPVLTLQSEGIARCAVSQVLVREESGVALFTQRFGAVDGLPEEEEGTILIVSLLVRQALPDRSDLASPGELVRDSAGNPVGCKGLAINA